MQKQSMVVMVFLFTPCYHRVAYGLRRGFVYFHGRTQHRRQLNRFVRLFAPVRMEISYPNLWIIMMRYIIYIYKRGTQFENYILVNRNIVHSEVKFGKRNMSNLTFHPTKRFLGVPTGKLSNMGIRGLWYEYEFDLS